MNNKTWKTAYVTVLYGKGFKNAIASHTVLMTSKRTNDPREFIAAVEETLKLKIKDVIKQEVPATYWTLLKKSWKSESGEVVFEIPEYFYAAFSIRIEEEPTDEEMNFLN